jgi:hypothetical protein
MSAKPALLLNPAKKCAERRRLASNARRPSMAGDSTSSVTTAVCDRGQSTPESRRRGAPAPAASAQPTIRARRASRRADRCQPRLRLARLAEGGVRSVGRAIRLAATAAYARRPSRRARIASPSSRPATSSDSDAFRRERLRRVPPGATQTRAAEATQARAAARRDPNACRRTRRPIKRSPVDAALWPLLPSPLFAAAASRCPTPASRRFG